MFKGYHNWIFAAVAAFGLFATGCNGADDNGDNGDLEAAEITIESNDLMEFDTDEFTVAPGQTVELTLVHVGEMGVEAMGHNVVILEQNEDPVAFGNEAADHEDFQDQDYLPEDIRDRVIAYTAMIGGGESDTVTFTAPEEPGEYGFVCTFPGHPMQMNGVMIVEE